jgi:general secretion pathway protein D
VLKPTARILLGLILVALGFPVLFSAAESRSLASDPAFGRSPAPQNAEEARRQSDELLNRARRALAENDLQAADQLISQAEGLGVEYGSLYLGDTPRKARHDLERKQQASGAPTRPSQMFSPIPIGKKPAAPATDPFAGRNVDPAAAVLPDSKTMAKSHLMKARQELDRNNLPGAIYWYNRAAEQPAVFGPSEDSPERLAADIRRRGGQVNDPVRPAGVPGGTVMPLPPVNQVAPMGDGRISPMGASQPSQPAQAAMPYGPPQPQMPAGMASPNRAESDKLLIQARRALALGDARTAGAKLQQVKSLGWSYGPNEDSPARIEAILAAYNDLLSQRATRGTTEAYRHQYARILVEQAQGLLRWREFDEAERLANTAAQQYANFAPSEVTPAALLERIAAERRQYQAGAPGVLNNSLTNSAPSLAAKQRAVYLVRQARAALRAGDFRAAEDLARQADRMQVPDSYFGAGEDRPSLVLADLQRSRLNGPSGVVQASGQYVTPATGSDVMDRRASQALYDPARDPTRNTLAGDQQPVPPPRPLPGPAEAAPGTPAGSPGLALFQQGEAALRAHQTDAALQYFRQAAAYSQQLDPVTQQRLQDLLQMLSAPPAGPAGPPPSNLDDAAAKQQALVKQIHGEVAHMEANAEKLRETDPKNALSILEQAREKTANAGLDPVARDQILRRVDRKIEDLKQFIAQHQGRIELDERNRQVKDGIDRERQKNLQVQEKLALMVDEYNQLMREQRFAEAEVVAKRAAELDPKNPLSQQLVLNAKFVRTYSNNMAIRNEKEQGFLDAMASVDQAAIPHNDMEPYVFGDAKHWEELTRKRSKWLSENNGRHRSERELEIERKLRTPVMLQFDNAPLSQVLEYLAKLAEVNLHLDPQGLAEEGVSSDTPVTITLSQEISLQSALNLILEPLHLSYVVKDEVLKITSAQLRNGEVYTTTYNVADLVVPIPNFTPSSRMGLAGALHDAMGNVGFNNGGAFGGSSAPMAVLASKNGNSSNASVNPGMLAQVSNVQQGAAGGNMPIGFGPGGLGGGTGADFDSLIDLITSTIQPTTWDEVGGPGSIAGFETNLSLVVSQTQDVHEQIVDLLEQLRRLQDLQVTIEVRFITLNDNFFERIGVDFDFDINDKIDRPYMLFGRPVENAGGDDDDDDDTSGGTGNVVRNLADQDFDRSVTVGLSAPQVFSADLDIPFRQNSYGVATPQFGGYDPSNAASLGFAILSDIEAYFFIEAAQGDKRSNVLQAPKVTLFNGQQAFVSDTSQSPFVISVVPVVGDFAAAQQPVIVVLSEGTFLTVQAVVSNDRRFVRLTLVPFFSKIGDVNTFTFEGSETSSIDSSEDGWVNPDDKDDKRRSKNANKIQASRSGTTVQLPTFSFVTVTTTVSVPDGGTVLLGGIKRLSEGRNEYGVPMLNKIPYISRLFKNVGIGRETQSLMMMVTPRIIIQEEEEERLGIAP